MIVGKSLLSFQLPYKDTVTRVALACCGSKDSPWLPVSQSEVGEAISAMESIIFQPPLLPSLCHMLLINLVYLAALFIARG